MPQQLNITIVERGRVVLAGLLLLASALWSGGCGSPSGPLFPELAEPLVWPAPPERARIKFLGALATEADVEGEISFGESLKQVLFGKEPMGVLISPYAVAVDEKEMLFVADPAGPTIHRMDLTARTYRQVSELPSGGKLETPVALAVADGLVYVADSSLGVICVFSTEGSFKLSFGGDVLKRPVGVACGTTPPRVYVADAAQHQVFVFDKLGQPLSVIGQRGSEPGEFNFPTHLWIDKQGKLYVSDTLNYRIQVFSEEGEHLLKFGQQGNRPGYLAHTVGVATDSMGNIYVSDRQFENVQVFDARGQILMSFGEEGSKAGSFWLPAGLWIDGDDRIFVADSFNKRVQVFQLLEREQP